MNHSKDSTFGRRAGLPRSCSPTPAPVAPCSCRFTRSPTRRAFAIVSYCSAPDEGVVRGRWRKFLRSRNPEVPRRRASRRSSLRLHDSAWAWLLEKEWRELLASRAWWVLLVVMGPLVGFAFTSAVRSYAEASGLNGTAAGVGEAFSPLVGIWAPTFSACELAAVFLLPFVAIRIIAGDRQSGALKLELQHPMRPATRIAAKGIILLAGWIVASAPALVAVVLWHSYGGSIYAPELVTVATGHLINAGLTIAIAAAAASITEHPSTAAILTLSLTVGTWFLHFIAAVQGGTWERLASYTPTTMVSDFQHGLIRLDAVIAALTLVALGLVLASMWLQLGVPIRRRVANSVAATAVAVLVISGGSTSTRSWDTSESRVNSFSRAD